MMSKGTAQSVCQQLASDADDEGSNDNITILMARFLQDDRPLAQRKAIVDTKESNRT
jgi:serine/threonine protein phosphatase PrpC